MNVVKMVGGIGNQMFQYALFKNFLEQGVETKYDHWRTAQYHNGFVLDKVFNIKKLPVDQSFNPDSLERVQEKTWPNYNQSILEKRNSYVEGNWQNVGYFPNQENLRNDLSFKIDLDKRTKDLLDEINETESVSIHIRKGDYTTMPRYFFQADWMNYYALAVGRILKNTKGVKFFVFSDDMTWTKRNSFIPNPTFIDWNKGNDSWKDMLLMSNCKHNITANSTFSWWGAWLNKNPNKLVTTPNKWFLDGTDSNLITLDEWIKI